MVSSLVPHVEIQGGFSGRQEDRGGLDDRWCRALHLVPGVGVEPTRLLWRLGGLSPLRLPIPPPGLDPTVPGGRWGGCSIVGAGLDHPEYS